MQRFLLTLVPPAFSLWAFLGGYWALVSPGNAGLFYVLAITVAAALFLRIACDVAIFPGLAYGFIGPLLLVVPVWVCLAFGLELQLSGTWNDYLTFLAAFGVLSTAFMMWKIATSGQPIPAKKPDEDF